MAENNDYPEVLFDALAARALWLEKSELGKLQEELRAFHSSYSIIYNLLLNKKLINRDPYKQEARISELAAPDASEFSEAERVEQLTVRLADYDNQLDFLVNFYQFNVEFLNPDRIKLILGLIHFIDWENLTQDSPLPLTRVIAGMIGTAREGLDPLPSSLTAEALAALSRSTGAVVQCLTLLSDYHREFYKSAVRAAVTSGLPAAEASVENIQQKFTALLPGKQFYPDLIEEIIKEDHSEEGPALRANILKSLRIPEITPRVVKTAVSFKSILLEGLTVIGSVSPALREIGLKIDNNQALIAKRKKSLWEIIRRFWEKLLNKEPRPVIFEIQYRRSALGAPVREQVDYHRLRSDMGKKSRILAGIAGRRGTTAARLEAMPEKQLLQLLDRSIRDVQDLYKTLAALDLFFKNDAPPKDRDRVKGIKPELAVIKNAIIRSNQIRYEYSAQIEEEELMKKLGIGVAV